MGRHDYVYRDGVLEYPESHVVDWDERADVIKLDHLFTSYVITVDGDLITGPNGSPCSRLVRLDRDDDPMIEVVRHGLCWAGRRGFAGFGLRDRPVSLSSLEAVARGDDLWPRRTTSGGRVIRDVGLRGVYLAPPAPTTYLADNAAVAASLVSEWRSSGRRPDELDALFDDPLEDRTRLLAMLGRQTWGCGRNADFGKSLRRVLDVETTRYRAAREKYRAFWRRLTKKGASVDLLRKCLLRYFASYVEASGSESVSPEDAAAMANVGIGFDPVPAYDPGAMRRAIDAIAEAAHKIREGYPCKGWKVKTGLVHEMDYDRLGAAVSGETDEDVVSNISYILAEARNGRFGHLIAERFRRCPQPPSWKCAKKHSVRGYGVVYWSQLLEHPYAKIGEARLREFRAGRVPYVPEGRVLTQLLRYNLNRCQFHKAVDQWLITNGYGVVDWAALAFERRYSKDKWGEEERNVHHRCRTREQTHKIYREVFDELERRRYDIHEICGLLDRYSTRELAGMIREDRLPLKTNA